MAVPVNLSECSQLSNTSSTTVNTTDQSQIPHPDRDRSTAELLVDIKSEVDDISKLGMRKRDSVSGFRSREWSFNCRRPTSVTIYTSEQEKHSPKRRNSMESTLSREPLECKRLHMRRGALWNPELMLMPQNTREKVQRDVEVRKNSLVRKMSNFLAARLDLDQEEDLF